MVPHMVWDLYVVSMPEHVHTLGFASLRFFLAPCTDATFGAATRTYFTSQVVTAGCSFCLPSGTLDALGGGGGGPVELAGADGHSFTACVGFGFGGSSIDGGGQVEGFSLGTR